MRSNWICAQLGAREHYAVPRALHRAGRLDTLYTDYWAGSVVRKMGPASRALRSMAGRYHPELASASVKSWNARALTWTARVRSSAGSSDGQSLYSNFIEVGKRFAGAVRSGLSRRSDLSAETVFFAYDTGALETLQWLRARGVRCVLDQMDPGRVEVSLVREEESRWPGWALRATDVPEEYFQRREQEWALADQVVVNSEFSRRALIRQGVTAEKLVVIPLCYEAEAENAELEANNGSLDPRSGSHRAKLRVLYLGQVILRKGIQYLIEAARLLETEPVQFDVVGTVGISENAVKLAPANTRFHGPISRAQVGCWYARSDVFALPTLSDGFAITQIEAMAHGRPVIATPNCGQVVADGKDGFIVPPGDANALAKAIVAYVVEPGLLQAHRAAALEKVKQFSLARLTENLVALERSLVGAS